MRVLASFTLLSVPLLPMTAKLVPSCVPSGLSCLATVCWFVCFTILFRNRTCTALGPRSRGLCSKFVACCWCLAFPFPFV